MPTTKPPRWAIHGGLVAPEWRGFWRGLVLAAPFWEGGGGPFNYRDQRFGTLTGPTWVSDKYGPALNFTGGTSADRIEWPDAGSLNDLTGDLSILIVWKRGSQASWQSLLSKRFTTGANRAEFFTNFNPDGGVDLFQWGFHAGNSFRVLSYSGVPAVGEQVVTVCTRKAGGTNRIFQDGVKRAESTITQSPVGVATDIEVGVHRDNLEDYLGTASIACIWKRELNENEALALTRDPFGMFRMWRPSSALAAAAAAARRIFITGG